MPGAWSLCQTAKHDLAEISFFAYLDIDTIREYLIKQVCEQVSVLLHEGGSLFYLHVSAVIDVLSVQYEQPSEGFVNMWCLILIRLAS